MTAIVGMVEKDKIWLGADSGASAGNIIVQRKNEKVFMVNDEYLIACCGSPRVLDLLKYSLGNHIPEQSSKDDDDELFIHTHFIEAVRACFDEGGVVTTVREEGEVQPGNFIVGYRNKLYHIESDFQVGMYYDNYCSDGSGIEYCLGSLYSTTGDPESRIKKALEAAAKFCPTVCGPFVVKSL